MRRTTALFGIVFCALIMRHLPVFAQQARSLTDRAYKTGVLQKIAGLVESKYVLTDKAKGFADNFQAKCASGAYDSFTEAKEFAEKVTADLIAITHDKHLNFRVMVPSDVGEKAAGSLHHPVRYFRLRAKENTGFYKLEWIEPRVGYVDLRRFYSFDQAKDTAVAAMKFLANAQAIIIDVRENGGGSGDYLSSYFLPYPTQLSGSFSRQTGSLTESWTRRDIGMEPRLDVPLFILTGPNTFSASESFAYDMQSRKRAILIGEPTKGGAHSVDVFGIDDQFEFYISTERAISPVTGGNWEGTGVIPDIRVPAASAADAAVVEAKKAAAAYGLGKDAGLKKAVEEMQTLADNAAGLYREGKNQAADAALDSLFKIAQRAGMISEFFVQVFAYNFQSPQDEQMLFALLKKNVEFFPESFTACELLASVYASKENKELALRYFQKVLELDPGNRNAAKMIEELGSRPERPAGTSRASSGEKPRPPSVLVLLGEWFGDAYFPLKEEIDARGWTMKRVGAPVRNRPATHPG
jgi:tetratricopeptide (TPR) repeat protein